MVLLTKKLDWQKARRKVKEAQSASKDGSVSLLDVRATRWLEKVELAALRKALRSSVKVVKKGKAI